MTFYHYTSLWHLQQILNDKILKTTPSNLKYPKDLRIIDGKAVSPATDNFHPVVWLSSVLDFDTAEDNGLKKSAVDKTEAAIAVEDTPDRKIISWGAFVDKYTPYLNEQDFKWMQGLKDTAPNFQTWYVSERPIEIDNDTTAIIFRPDILDTMKNGEQIDGISLQ